ncbi:MAG: RNA polymerase sigma-70 factor [Bacteroidota bacterium]
MIDDVKQRLNELITAGKNNEAASYLWKQYYDILLKFAVAYLKKTELAEEVVSDVLYQIWNNKANLNQIQNMRVYVFTAVRNRCYTQLNKQKRELALFKPADELKEDCSFDNGIDPEKLMINSELIKFISEIVEDLPPRCKQIYKMVREEGLRNKDVAQQLGISVNTIDVQLAIAVKKLTKALQLYFNR